MRGWRALVACALGAACALTPALAQLPTVPGQSGPDQSGEGLHLEVEIGLGGVIVLGRWAPVTIRTTAHAPMSGELQLDYGLDPTQSMRITSGFSTTPGRMAPTRMVAPMPTWLSGLEVVASAVDGAGEGWITRRNVSGFGGPTAGDLRLPNSLSDGAVLIGVIGRSSAHSALEALTSATSGQRAGGAPADVPASTLARLSGADTRLIEESREAVWVALEPERLPEAPLGYDAATVVIVRADVADEMSSAQIAAVRRWTMAGGRLVLLASSAGDHWRTWLDDGASLPVALGGARPVELPREVALVARAARAEAPDPINARPITITPAGAASAWTVEWLVPGDPEGAGLLARGPLGLGQVTVLGVEPGGATGDARGELAAGMWLRALLDPLEAPLRAGISLDPVNYFPAYGHVNTSQTALVEVLDSLAVAAPAGAGAFIAIAIAAGVLALLVGPVDYVLLGRLRARRRWWLTALVWIGLASALAWWGPTIVRTEPTSVRRHETIDVLLTGTPGAEPTWTTGVTALFAAQAGNVEFAGQAPGSWWRGVSPLGADYWDQTPPTTFTHVRITAPGPSSPGQGLLGRSPVRMWTLRTFLDQGAGRRPMAVRLVEGEARVGSGTGVPGVWAPAEVEVVGLGADERIEEIALRIGDRVWSSKLGAPAPEREESGAGGGGGAGAGRIVRWRPGQESVSAIGRGFRAGSLLSPGRIIDPPAPPPAFGLEGARQRGETIDRLLASGRFAVLYLETVSIEPAVSITWDSEYQVNRVYRIVIPIGSAQ